jgi:hypothetical protein
MALFLNIQTSNIGVSVNQAYAKIDSFLGHNNTLNFGVMFYYNQDARQKFATPIFSKNHVINLSEISGDILPALYNYLKTLPEYEGATDC